MKPLKFVELFADNSIRIDKLIWIEGNACSVSEQLSDIIDYDLDKLAKAVNLKESILQGDAEDVVLELINHGKTGFLLEVHIPAPEYTSETMYSSSWSGTFLKLFYTAELGQDLFDQILAWKKTIHDKAKEKFRNPLIKVKA